MENAPYGSLDLNGTWELYYTDDFPKFLVAENLPGRHCFQATVPASVHQVLQDAGYLDDPRVGLNSLKARWVEETWWGYRRAFPTPTDYAPETPAWLVFERLELNAVVYLNGVEVGRHANAHRPARFEVTDKLRADGDNVLVVLLESGLFENSDKPGAEYRDTPQAKLTKIHWQRRGQWQRGWDWQQRLLTVGITGDVFLEWTIEPFPKQTTVYAVPSSDLSNVTFHVRLVVETPLRSTGEPFSAGLHINVYSSRDDGPQTLLANKVISLSLKPGESIHEVSVDLANPRLWWPVGQGEQYRYDVAVDLTSERADGGFGSIRRVGVRKVEVDQSPHPEEGRYFILKINDRPIFCKGGNWVPADMDMSTVTAERYRELIDLALGANFNLLRIWGGGVFADSAFLDYCDEKGVLVWHDLLFACSKYPGDFPAFAAEVRSEVTRAMREMAHHASLVVWCGNNEIEEGDWNWGYDRFYRTHPHYALFHHDLPQIATREAPASFYWISSPYSPDYKNPQDQTVGDQHPWRVSLQMAGGADWWEYRPRVDRFPNEGGVLGCSTPATLRQFLPEKEQHVLSPSWEHHDNPFAINDTQPGNLGHAYQTVQLWTGLNPLAMDLETYAFASGLLQAEGLTEYITNYRRRMFSSAAAIFWMYNDSWPATHGWTIVDYYGRKKLAYHPVRRAFAPVSVIVAQDTLPEDHPEWAGTDATHVFVVNETNQDWTGTLHFGYFGVRGGSPVATHTVTVSANSCLRVKDSLAGSELEVRTKAGKFGMGAFALLSDGSGASLAQHRVFVRRFHELNLETYPKIDLTLDKGVLTLKSDVFVWGVCLDTDGDKAVSDNCFDLLPGVPYTLPWDEAVLDAPRVLRTGNGLFANSIHQTTQ